MHWDLLPASNGLGLVQLALATGFGCTQFWCWFLCPAAAPCAMLAPLHCAQHLRELHEAGSISSHMLSPALTMTN